MNQKEEAKVARLLRALYHHENVHYSSERERREVTVPEGFAAKDLEFLESFGLGPNRFESLTHDGAIERMLSARDRLTLEIARDRFIEGVAGQRVRGRQTLMSFLYAKGLKAHAFSPNTAFGSNLVHASEDYCEHCGLPETTTVDRAHELMGLYIGHSSNEGKVAMLLDLEEAATDEHVPAGAESVATVRKLLEGIAAAPDGEAPSTLEKRISKEKLAPKSDKYKRHGILQTLAEFGVMPNPHLPGYHDRFTTLGERIEASQKLTTSHRSDIVLPLAGWNGSQPINEERASLLLAHSE